MKRVDKGSLKLILTLFSNMLKESNLVIGILVDKEDPEDSKLVFVDADEAVKGDYKGGATVETAELNKWVNNGHSS